MSGGEPRGRQLPCSTLSVRVNSPETRYIGVGDLYLAERQSVPVLVAVLEAGDLSRAWCSSRVESPLESG